MEQASQSLRQALAAGLKHVRQAQGLSQDQVADLVRRHGLTTWIRGTVAQAEVGARRLPLEEVLLLAVALGISPADLVGGRDDELIELAPDVRLSTGTVRSLLSGEWASLGDRRPQLVDAPATAAVGEAERYVARKVGTTPEVVNEVALRRWERTWSQERDRRLAERAPEASASQRHALRGHITRELLTELESDLRAATRGEAPSKRAKP